MDHKKAMKAAFMVAVMASMAFIGMTAASEGASETSETGYGEMTWGSGTDIGSISVEVGKKFSFSKSSWDLPLLNIQSISVDWVEIAYSGAMSVSGTAPSEAGTYSVTAPFTSPHGEGTLTLTIVVWKEAVMRTLTVESERLANVTRYSGPITGEFSVALIIGQAGSPVVGMIHYGDARLAFDGASQIVAPHWVSSITKYESVGQIGGNSGFYITGKVPEGHELTMELMKTGDVYSIRFYADGVPSVSSSLSFLSSPSKSGVYEWHGL